MLSRLGRPTILKPSEPERAPKDRLVARVLDFGIFSEPGFQNSIHAARNHTVWGGGGGGGTREIRQQESPSSPFSPFEGLGSERDTAAHRPQIDHVDGVLAHGDQNDAAHRQCLGT